MWELQRMPMVEMVREPGRPISDAVQDMKGLRQAVSLRSGAAVLPAAPVERIPEWSLTQHGAHQDLQTRSYDDHKQV